MKVGADPCVRPKTPYFPRAHTWVRPYVVDQTIAFVRNVAVVTALAAVISPQGGERAAASTAPTYIINVSAPHWGILRLFASQILLRRPLRMTVYDHMTTSHSYSILRILQNVPAFEPFVVCHKDVAGLASLVRAHYAELLHVVDHSAGAGVAHLQAALEH